MPSYLSYRRVVLDKEWDASQHPRNPDGTFTDAEGNPLDLYHGSLTKIREYNQSKGIGFHFGTKKAAQQRINGKGVLNRVNLKAGGILEVPDLNDWDGTTVVHELERLGIFTKENTKPYWDYRNNGGDMEHEKYDSPVNTIVRQILLDMGYNTLVYKNEVEDPGEWSYMVLTPEQIKSLDD